MEWSKEQKEIVNELSQLPAFSLTSQQRYDMYQQIQKGVLQLRKSRKRKLVLGSMAGVAAAVVLTVGLMNQGMTTNLIGGSQYGYATGQMQEDMQTLEFRVQTHEGQPMTLTQEQQIVLGTLIKSRLDAAGIVDHSIHISNDFPVRVGVPTTYTAEQIVQLKQLITNPPRLEIQDNDGRLLATGRDLFESVRVDTVSPFPAVTIKLRDMEKFQLIAKEYLGQSLAIFVDSVKVYDPVVQTANVNDEISISARSEEDAKNLALRLQAGLLNLTLEEVVHP